jgi:transposase
VLLVDGYSGYNDVEKISSRRRAACFAHVRRYFFDSLKTAPVAQEALDLITELYRVEHAAKEQRLSKTAYLAFRKQRAGPIRERFKGWLDAQRERHPPKSPLGIAIRYTLGQWEELGIFLRDARVSLDNNASERSLRRIALGRNNYLFVGDVASGKSLVGLPGAWAAAKSGPSRFRHDQAFRPIPVRLRIQGGHRHGQQDCDTPGLPNGLQPRLSLGTPSGAGPLQTSPYSVAPSH